MRLRQSLLYNWHLMAFVPTYVCDRSNKTPGEVVSWTCGERAGHTCALCDGHFCDKHATHVIVLIAGVSVAALSPEPSNRFRGDAVRTHAIYTEEKTQPALSGVRIEARVCETCQWHTAACLRQTTSEELAAALAPAQAEFVKQCAALIAARMLST